jgi:assimilatory nitrate reductase catalytic subunit
MLRLELASAGEPDKAAMQALEGLFGAPPVTRPSAIDRALCACLAVRESAVRGAIAGGAGLERLQSELKCGTSCGSCVPELKRLVSAAQSR